MQDMEYVKRYEPVWGSWSIDSFIGDGSFGKVYRVSKEDWGFKYISALKFISVPSPEQYREAVASVSSDPQILAAYFKDAVKSIINEIRLMYSLRGNSSIISYEDHLVERRADGTGWDILIRMEYASSLSEYASRNDVSAENVIQLGIDICEALEACSRKGIIHRDIKGENIFISEGGGFKLGDFGISRELSGSGRAGSMKGTPLYMAPEVYRGQPYDSRADLYSLGIVLYKLMNYGRLPFMPPYPLEIKYRDSEAAFEKRMGGEMPPPPLQAGEDFGKAIIKACSFNPDERHASASELRAGLSAVLCGMSENARSQLVSCAKSPRQENNSVQAAPTEIISSSANAYNPAIEETVSIFSSNPQYSRNPDEGVSTPGNIANGGIVCGYGPHIYYSPVNQDSLLIREGPDESGQIILSRDLCWFINVAGNTLCYSNASDGDSLYKINTDGSGRTRLSNDKCWDIRTAGDTIYYINESDGYGIYSIKTDGSGRTKIAGDSSGSLNLSSGWLYYSNKSDGGKLYKMTAGGMERTRINDDNSDFVNISGEWLYYCNKSDGFRLYRVRTDGTCRAMLCSDMSLSLNVHGGWVYYSNKSDNGSLYKISIHGCEKLKLTHTGADYINIAGEWIYYCSRDEGGRLCRIGLDGKGISNSSSSKGKSLQSRQ